MGTPDQTPLTFIGLGNMGGPMALRLVGAGVPLTVHNRTRARAEALRQAGARVAEDLEEAVSAGEGVFLMLTDAPAIDAVLDAPGVESALRGRTLIQMGTIAPEQSRGLSRRLEALGAAYLEAPVLGGVNEAARGGLLAMLGGEPEVVRRWNPVVRLMASQSWHVGPAGQAALLKLALNQLVASMTTAYALSLAMVERGGVPPETFKDVLGQTGLYASTFEKKYTRMLGRQFDPQFSTRLVLKDVELILQAATSLGLDTVALEGTRALAQRALALGLGELDYSALYAAVNPEAQPRRGGG
jgi:3-hydroxyisobutyrate dehydrogenase